MANSKLKFSLKEVNENEVGKTLKQIKKKKSSGYDGLTQDQLLASESQSDRMTEWQTL